MAKPVLVRRSFNAGELSPELWYRDDLEAYVKGCKHLTNMTATPYGAVTRRPPMELLAKIDTARFGIPIRYIPFKFSLTEVFHIVFTDGSGTDGTDPDTADLIIFNADGSQVIFDGAPAPLSILPAVLPAVLSSGVVMTTNTIYKPADLGNIHYINVNDFVYLTCGGDYPVQVINRFFDIEEGGNRWKIEPFKFRGGPFLDPNAETGQTLTTKTDEYSASETYLNGDAVWGIEAGESVDEPAWHPIGGSVYQYRLRLVGHGLKAGEKIQLEGLTLTGGSSCFFRGTTTQARGDIGGEYTVSAHTSYTFYISLYVKVESGGSLPSTTGAGEIWRDGEYGGFYGSIQDGNTGNSLDDELWWESLDRYTGEVTIESNQDMFFATDVERLIQIDSENVEGTSGDWVNDQVSKPILGGSLVDLTTEGGAWGGKLDLQESKDGGLTWEDIGSIESTDGSYNGSIERDISEPSSLVRVRLSGWVTPTTTYNKKSCSWNLKTPNGVSEIYKVTEYIDARTVKALTVTPIDRPRSDHRWALGSWSETSGYPYSLTIHDERVCFGGCREKPNTVYASRVNDWGNFLEGFLETSPYEFTIASDSFDAIRSLKSSRQLNIFTDNAENTMGSRDDNAVTSVTNISVSSHTNYGSSGVQAVQMADMIWFCMGQSERVRASRYDFASDGQQSIEMSLFAHHITKSGIKEMSFRRHPFNSLFCVLNNGTACSLTYEGMQEVKAWTRNETPGGSIISAASNYSDKGDIVAGVVKRGDEYTLEVFRTNTEETVFLDNQTQWKDVNFFIPQPILQDDDGGLTVIHDDTALVRDVDYTIANGALRIPAVSSGVVTIGRLYQSRVNPTDPSEVAPSGVVKRLSSLGLYLLDSGTCKVAINGKDAPFTDGHKLGAGERISGLFDMTTGGDYSEGLDVDITIDNHRPFTLTGLGYRLTGSN